MGDKEQDVLDILKNASQPLKTAEIVENAKLNSKDVSKIVLKLKKGELVASPKRCYYSLS